MPTAIYICIHIFIFTCPPLPTPPPLAIPNHSYVNVCMEFNVATLRPTYRLMWGSSGASNALAIAAALGFDSGVLQEAAAVVAAAGGVGGGATGGRDSALHVAAVARSLVAQLEETKVELDVARVSHHRSAPEHRGCTECMACTPSGCSRGVLDPGAGCVGLCVSLTAGARKVEWQGWGIARQRM